MGLIRRTPEQRKYYDAKNQKWFDKNYYYDEDGYLIERERKLVIVQKYTPRRLNVRRTNGHRQRQEGSRSSAASGDGNSDSDDADPEPERNQNPLQLLDQQSLADLLCVSKKTLQNQYSVAPYTLPEAIQIPHARGPRWTIQAVQDWLANRPRHTQKLTPVAPKRKAGRPRIAHAVAKGGAK